jgi:hypothetical protein
MSQLSISVSIFLNANCILNLNLELNSEVSNKWCSFTQGLRISEPKMMEGPLFYAFSSVAFYFVLFLAFGPFFLAISNSIRAKVITPFVYIYMVTSFFIGSLVLTCLLWVRA